MAMRRLGVYGDNLPTKKERSVQPADFTIAGLYAKFDRKYDKVFRFRNQQEAIAVLGDQTNPADYGWDALNGFFANLQGQPGSIIVASYKGAGAAQATTDIQIYLRISSAYLGEPCYGVAGNRIGYTLTKGSVFTANVVADSTTAVVSLDSVAGIKVGDVVDINSVFHTVSAIDEGVKAVTLAAAVTVVTGDEVKVVAYQLKTFQKSPNGIVNEVDAQLGKTWVTTNKTDSNRYICSVFKNSQFIDISYLADVPTGGLTAVTTVTYLTGGTDGTAPATKAAFAPIWSMMDHQPIRMMACPETAVTDIQQSLEEYGKNREDNPIAMLLGQMDLQNKQSVISVGQAFQRGNEVDAVFVHNWVTVPDPFASSPTAPKRQVPAVGHLMGHWIQSIGLNGIHSSPARKDVPLLGVSDVIGYQALNDFDRTDLAEAGVNVIQQISGRGIIVRNHFTPSTSPEFKYSNAVIQRNFIKISSVDSLQTSENTPNSINRVREDRLACVMFMNKLWSYGSTGSVPEGETFGRYEREDGSMSSREDAFEVIANYSNNSVATLQAGERNIDIYFMFPAPAGSIKIGVGIIYRVS